MLRQPRLWQSHWWKVSVLMWLTVSCPGPQRSTPVPQSSETSTSDVALRLTRYSSLCFKWWRLDAQLSATVPRCSEGFLPHYLPTGRRPVSPYPRTPPGTFRPPVSSCPAWERANSCLLCWQMSTKLSPISLPSKSGCCSSLCGNMFEVMGPCLKSLSSAQIRDSSAGTSHGMEMLPDTWRRFTACSTKT